MAKFHPYHLTCPDCGKPALHVTVAFRVDGMIRFDSLCADCDQEMYGEVKLSEILSWCAIYDEFPENVTAQRGRC